MKSIIALALVMAFLTDPVMAEDAPPALLEAIARQESGKNPLAVNVAGKDHYPASKEEAIQIIRQAQAEEKSFDVGLFQVNSWWIERYRIPPESLLDPAINRQWGVFILEQEIARHGLNWKAVGKYHSPDRERGRRYAWKIYWHYAGMAESKEAGNGKAVHGHKNISVTGGIQRYSGISPQGKVITFDVQQTGMPWHSGSKPGASGGPAGTAKDER
ncbi:MAG: lytic transglycosylase domain-containing protein [Desulfovibrionaceae bacterium]|nr:lytic transglycosylase domain-containing protein [Desulfovibrionaceae bacterium]